MDSNLESKTYADSIAKPCQDSGNLKHERSEPNHKSYPEKSNVPSLASEDGRQTSQFNNHNSSSDSNNSNNDSKSCTVYFNRNGDASKNGIVYYNNSNTRVEDLGSHFNEHPGDSPSLDRGGNRPKMADKENDLHDPEKLSRTDKNCTEGFSDTRFDFTSSSHHFDSGDCDVMKSAGSYPYPSQNHPSTCPRDRSHFESQGYPNNTRMEPLGSNTPKNTRLLTGKFDCKKSAEINSYGFSCHDQNWDGSSNRPTVQSSSQNGETYGTTLNASGGFDGTHHSDTLPSSFGFGVSHSTSPPTSHPSWSSDFRQRDIDLSKINDFYTNSLHKQPNTPNDNRDPFPDGENYISRDDRNLTSLSQTEMKYHQTAHSKSPETLMDSEAMPCGSIGGNEMESENVTNRRTGHLDTGVISGLFGSLAQQVWTRPTTTTSDFQSIQSVAGNDTGEFLPRLSMSDVSPNHPSVVAPSGNNRHSQNHGQGKGELVTGHDTITASDAGVNRGICHKDRNESGHIPRDLDTFKSISMGHGRPCDSQIRHGCRGYSSSGKLNDCAPCTPIDTRTRPNYDKFTTGNDVDTRSYNGMNSVHSQYDDGSIGHLSCDNTEYKRPLPSSNDGGQTPGECDVKQSPSVDSGRGLSDQAGCGLASGKEKRDDRMSIDKRVGVQCGGEEDGHEEGKSEERIGKEVTDVNAEEVKILLDPEALSIYDCAGEGPVMYPALLCVAPQDITLFALPFLVDLKRLGYRVFLPQRDLVLTGPYYENLARVIKERCNGKVIVIVSKNYSSSEECLFLTYFAKTLDPAAQRRSIIPIYIDKEIPNLPNILLGLSNIHYNQAVRNHFLKSRIDTALAP